MTRAKAPLLLLVLLSTIIPRVHGHGSLVHPPPRGGIDKILPEFSNGSYPKGHYPCTCVNGTDKYCHPGQSCLWFNQGCTIGCECTGNGTNSRIPNYQSCTSGIEPTNNNPSTRTLNRGAVAGSEHDVYKYMPWRAPGSAILNDACGIAGGSPIHQGNGGEYYETRFAKQGDKGSQVLAPLATGVIWKAGTSVQASVFIQANHAGGWQYRLCPADAELSEECFQQTPLAFDQSAGQQLLLSDGSIHQLNGTYLREGTFPKGSAWVMNPVPECCPPEGACERQGLLCGSSEKSSMGHECYSHQCGVDSGLGPSKPEFPWPTMNQLAPPTNIAPKFAIIDTLQIPTNLKPGNWVLGWRWDAEETAQVWTACADITIAA